MDLKPLSPLTIPNYFLVDSFPNRNEIESFAILCETIAERIDCKKTQPHPFAIEPALLYELREQSRRVGILINTQNTGYLPLSISGASDDDIRRGTTRSVKGWVGVANPYGKYFSCGLWEHIVTSKGIQFRTSPESKWREIGDEIRQALKDWAKFIRSPLYKPILLNSVNTKVSDSCDSLKAQNVARSVLSSYPDAAFFRNICDTASLIAVEYPEYGAEFSSATTPHEKDLAKSLCNDTLNRLGKMVYDVFVHMPQTAKKLRFLSLVTRYCHEEPNFDWEPLKADLREIQVDALQIAKETDAISPNDGILSPSPMQLVDNKSSHNNAGQLISELRDAISLLHHHGTYLLRFVDENEAGFRLASWPTNEDFRKSLDRAIAVECTDIAVWLPESLTENEIEEIHRRRLESPWPYHLRAFDDRLQAIFEAETAAIMALTRIPARLIDDPNLAVMDRRSVKMRGDILAICDPIRYARRSDKYPDVRLTTALSNVRNGGFISKREEWHQRLTSLNHWVAELFPIQSHLRDVCLTSFQVANVDADATESNQQGTAIELSIEKLLQHFTESTLTLEPLEIQIKQVKSQLGMASEKVSPLMLKLIEPHVDVIFAKAAGQVEEAGLKRPSSLSDWRALCHATEIEHKGKTLQAIRELLVGWQLRRILDANALTANSAKGKPTNITTPESQTPLNELTPAKRKAYLSLQYAKAISENELKTDRDIHNFLLESEFDNLDANIAELCNYELPDYATWVRYIREARKITGTNKYTPRAGREMGSSIVKQSRL